MGMFVILYADDILLQRHRQCQHLQLACGREFDSLDMNRPIDLRRICCMHIGSRNVQSVYQQKYQKWSWNSEFQGQTKFDILKFLLFARPASEVRLDYAKRSFYQPVKASQLRLADQFQQKKLFCDSRLLRTNVRRFCYMVQMYVH